MVVAFLSALAAVATATPIDRASWFSANDYPIEALKKGLQGSVSFEVDVDADGKPAACRVTKSSGQPILDQTTCDVVRLRAHFKPALDANGKPVAGRYATNAIWKLAAGSPPAFHHAVILDFSDPDHPACKIETTAPAGGRLPTCEEVLAQGQLIAGLGRRYIKTIFLETAGPADQKAYEGEADWGPRLSYLANELYFVRGAAVPIACVSVAAEGMAAGKDACVTSPGPHSLSEADRKNAYKIGRTEFSTFGVPRPPEPRSNRCKTGESAAESSGCK